MPAPAVSRPSAIDEPPMRASVVCSQPGGASGQVGRQAGGGGDDERVAHQFAANERSPWRAIGHTAATLASGTHTPISTATSSWPCGPSQRSAMARPMKELKRNAICALAAWLPRTSITAPQPRQPGQGPAQRGCRRPSAPGRRRSA
jgi:hypothetical protein